MISSIFTLFQFSGYLTFNLLHISLSNASYLLFVLASAFLYALHTLWCFMTSRLLPVYLHSIPGLSWYLHRTSLCLDLRLLVIFCSLCSYLNHLSLFVYTGSVDGGLPLFFYFDIFGILSYSFISFIFKICLFDVTSCLI